MGNRSRKRKCQIKRSRFLCFEPLGTRLPFSVDYAVWETNLFSDSVTVELQANRELVNEWPVVELEATATPYVNTIYDPNSAIDVNSISRIGFTNSHSFLPIDTITTPSSDDFLDSIVGATDSTSILFSQAFLEVLGLSDTVWAVASVPLQHASVASGPSTDLWTAPTPPVQLGSTLDFWLSVGEAVPADNAESQPNTTWLRETGYPSNLTDIHLAMDVRTPSLSPPATCFLASPHH